MIKWTPQELAEMAKADKDIESSDTLTAEEWRQAAERDQKSIQDAKDNKSQHTSMVRKAETVRRAAKRKEYRKQYHIENQEKENAYSRKYLASHREERLQYKGAYYSIPENVTRHRETSAKYYWEHRDEINAKKRERRAKKRELDSRRACGDGTS